MERADGATSRNRRRAAHAVAFTPSTSTATQPFTVSTRWRRASGYLDCRFRSSRRRVRGNRHPVRFRPPWLLDRKLFDGCRSHGPSIGHYLRTLVSSRLSIYFGATVVPCDYLKSGETGSIRLQFPTSSRADDVPFSIRYEDERGYVHRTRYLIEAESQTLRRQEDDARLPRRTCP